MINNTRRPKYIKPEHLFIPAISTKILTYTSAQHSLFAGKYVLNEHSVS